ncbi:PREDICTED: uncharacterized protein K02A2.6-like [Acropora digitifera]|uniref:uncharacterized protein K02A2.6-like n=1 Tax=Acropora digitifera TaxID=70779 RepID=UPI00077ADEE8|nr:PREDICTED: uncharacterized protein K02A2.6-like [Acropora digitifera]
MVIPKNLRATVLTIGHKGHLGVVSMKQRLRTKVWWPKLEKEVEKFFRTCDGCEHILVVVDYYSRYYETDVVKTVTSQQTIKSLEAIFARHGLPEVLTSDNGPHFVSEEFEAYLKESGIKHRHVTAKWAQANGEVERQNSLILKRLRWAHAEGKDWKRKLVRYTAVYQTTPPYTTGKTPAFLIMDYYIRTKLPQLSQPVHGDEETRDRNQAMNFKSKQYADTRRHARISDLQPDDNVLLRQEKRNKMSTTFGTQLYKVRDIKGNQVIISDCENPERVFYRNTTDVKRYYSSDEQPRIIKVELKEDPTPAVNGNTCDADPKSGDALSHPSHPRG